MESGGWRVQGGEWRVVSSGGQWMVVAARPNARFLEDVGTVPARSEPGFRHNQRVIEAIAGRDILCAVVVVVVVWGRWRGAYSSRALG